VSQKKHKQVIVTMRCTVTKEVVCENCTEEEARNAPWDHAVDERELGQEDWEVRSIRVGDN
jgi:hypothetical protein